MARISVGDKATRVLRFLMGLRDPRILAALAPHGFSEQNRREGYALLRGLTDDRLAHIPAAPRDLGALEQLDRWERLWFPVAHAALQHHHPETHEALFRDLSPANGSDLVHAVGTFLDRVAALATWNSPTVSDGIAYLAHRGLDAARLDEGRRLLDAVEATMPATQRPPVDPDLSLARERAMWTWYLEWSGIACASISDPRLLGELGFGSRRASAGDVDIAPGV
jgi:hypothetical protein